MNKVFDNDAVTYISSRLKDSIVSCTTIPLATKDLRDLLHNLAGEKPAVIFQKRDRSLRKPLYTVIATDFRALFQLDNDKCTVLFDNGQSEVFSRDSECPFDYLARVQEAICPQAAPGLIPDGIEYANGLIGYLGFGLTSAVERIEKQTVNPLNVPDATMMLPGAIIFIDHTIEAIHVISHRGVEHGKSLARQVLQCKSRRNTSARILPSLKPRLQTSISKEQFIENVLQAKEFIRTGQCFQIVLSQRFHTPNSASALDVFTTLLETAPSTYNYCLNFSDFQYVGASPETMVMTSSGTVRLCALAGTRPRGATAQQDQLNEAELTSNEKELAEHLMLVDLGRNDLGKVCQPGSIKVGPIAQVLRYSNVMHLGTEISGSLCQNQTAFATIKACFPRGTVSGAPKVRALELLSKLEPEQRGIYAGAVGFIDSSGSMDTAIAIRSVLLKDGMAHINAGAGIVFDSIPEHEYQETIDKASAIASVVDLANRKIDQSIGMDEAI